MSLVAACFFVFFVADGIDAADAAGDSPVLDGVLPWGRVSASACRVVVVVEGKDPGGTVEALRKQDRG